MTEINSLKNEISEGDRVNIKKDEVEYTGIIMPTSRKNEIVLKLDNGYNIGLNLNKIQKIDLIKKSEKEKEEKTFKQEKNEDNPLLSILSTGGTIASSVDYRTGAVTSKFDADDILTNIPELRDIADYRSSVVYNILSENMKPSYWVKLSKAIEKEIKKDVDGIIVAHGTDTMSYTASAISFMVKSPIPIVFVGSQRSADRPSSDNVLNAVSAAKMAKSDIAETMVVMHAESSDSYCFAHRATKVRKMHTSRRDAFRSIDQKPLAKVDNEVKILCEDYKERKDEFEIRNEINEDVSLIKFTPGMDPSILDKIKEDNDGIVIEGTGLGHVSNDWIPHIRRCVEENIPVVMTSQCLYGRVTDRVYDTGRDLIDAGIIQGEDMLPEVAYVKLMWSLPRTETMKELRELMNKNIAGEINKRTKNGYYLI